MKILQICFRVPFPPHDGGAIAMYGITRNLSLQGHEVTVLAVNTPKHFQSENVLNGIARLKTVFIDTTISPIKALLNFFQPLPYILERFVSKDFEIALIKLLNEEEFDIIHFEGTYVAWYVDVASRYSKVPKILRSHNLEHLIWERLAKNVSNPFKRFYYNYLAKGLKKFEKAYYQKFDAIAAITPEDAQRIKDLGINPKIEFIPAGVDSDVFRKNSEFTVKPDTCFILSALNWIPNQEALYWFLENVWPEITRKFPSLELHIAGKGTPDKIFKLQNSKVIVHGFVKEASEFMQNYELMLVPLLAGGGMRLKIIEGMAVDKCIVSSSVGAEGIDCANGKNILICDSPEEWINCISNYFTNRDKFKKIGENAGELIREKYLNSKVVERLVSLYQEVSS